MSKTKHLTKVIASLKRRKRQNLIFKTSKSLEDVLNRLNGLFSSLETHLSLEDAA